MPERVVAIVPVDTLQNVEEKIPAEQLDAMMKQLRADYKGTVTALMNQFFFSASTPAADRKYASQFDVAIIKGIGHYPMLEEPARFNQLLTEILRSLPRA